MAAIRAAAGAQPADIKAEGVNDAFKFIKHQLFLAGLKDGICDKVLEAAKASFNESVKAASNLETVQNYHKRLNRIAAIKAELQSEEAREIIWDDLTDRELEQLAIIQAFSGLFLPKKNNSPASNNGQ
jgi:hypothetical protein